MDKLSVNQIKQKKQNEKDSYIMMKNLIKKPTVLKPSDFKPGQIILYSYSAKYDKNPYDASPVCFVLARTKKHTIGINWNWIPVALRNGLMKMVLSKQNLKNIEKGKDLYMPKNLVKQIFRLGLPAFRKYLNNRISAKGVVLPHTLYRKVINLRAENFIGISSEDAWKIAINKIKANKNATRKRRK